MLSLPGRGWGNCGSATMAEASVSVLLYVHSRSLRIRGQFPWADQGFRQLCIQKPFPTPTQNRPDSLETLVFVSLITSSDSALRAVWMAYPFPLPGSRSLLLHCEKIMARNLMRSQCQLPGVISTSTCEFRVLWRWVHLTEDLFVSFPAHPLLQATE